MTDEQKQFLQDVLCTAAEGGCDYWAIFRNVRRNGNLDYLSFDIRDAEDPEAAWHSITLTKLDKAIRRLLLGEAKAGRHIVQQFAGYPGNIDATDHDADGADVVVQIAAFGEIVFG
jgi:hypothetical protein